MTKVNLAAMSAKEKEELLNSLQTEKQQQEINNRDAYESIKQQFIDEVQAKIIPYTNNGLDLMVWLRGEANAFMKTLKDYGCLKRDDQIGFTVSNDNFKIMVNAQRVKKFDERADVAAKRLVDFLTEWIKDSKSGSNDPLYSLAMTLLQRNEMGELDYKSISKLYELEGKFNSQEYSDIMKLFRESNVITGTASYFKFEMKDADGNWQKLEPSFCRM
jgi:hypothetical protein